jgi:hypothetical protein
MVNELKAFWLPNSFRQRRAMTILIEKSNAHAMLENAAGDPVRRQKPEESSECKFRIRQDFANRLGLE